MQSSQTGLCGKFVDLSQSGGWLFHNPNSFVQIFQNSIVVFLESKCFELNLNQNDEIMANIKQLVILTEQKLSTDLLASQVVAW